MIDYKPNLELSRNYIAWDMRRIYGIQASPPSPKSHQVDFIYGPIKCKLPEFSLYILKLAICSLSLLSSWLFSLLPPP